METEAMKTMTRIGRWLVVALLLVMSPVCFSQAAETVTYYYTDQQGTPLATADASGNILTTSDYRPYGSEVLGTPVEGPGYTGHVNDLDSGLLYMQARYYDPVVGRFLSTDPQGVTVGHVHNFGLYEYANSNPVGNVDPDGKETFAIGFNVSISALGGVTGTRQITVSMDGLKISTLSVGYYNAAGGTASTAIGPSLVIVGSYSKANSAEEFADTGGAASAGGGVNVFGASGGYEQSICDRCNSVSSLYVGGKIPQLPFEVHASITQSVGYTIFGNPPAVRPTVKVGDPKPSPPPPPPPPTTPLVPSTWTIPST
ncbi:hypothetical protein L2Y94_09705 [Luteibacter aegosomatis]|uniref:RHS repeat-associated core domain-containing protein n=1 Tax=Luteibacter aegosomatis TaxID=2911537 RepID=UPI001FFB81D1|nr:RHS repeat-associated core domain-containing protein [Luteibacter aegosomatis]UPG87604.1 hypothetical protein L2Y94_09705 [Luteibacter aegosomatis]